VHRAVKILQKLYKKSINVVDFYESFSSVAKTLFCSPEAVKNEEAT